MESHNPLDTSLARRIEELEQRYRRLSRVIPVLLVFAALPYLLGQSFPLPQSRLRPDAAPQQGQIRLPAHATFSSVTAERYLMKDGNGITRGALFINRSGGSQLSLFDSKGNEIASITNAMRLYSDKSRSVIDSFGLGLYSADGKKQCLFAAWDKPGTGLHFYTPIGEYAGTLLTGDRAQLQFVAKDGTSADIQVATQASDN